MVDLGCAPHGTDISVQPLIERFHPRVLYGFDPLQRDVIAEQDGTRVVLSPRAAWTHDGYVGIVEDGIRTQVFESEAGCVPCFDLARFLSELPDEEIVLKLDVEGGEYELLPHLHATCVDERVSLCLVEWHGEGRVALRCPIEEWDHGLVVA